MLQAGIYLIEVDEPAIEFEVLTAKGHVSLIADLVRIDDYLMFDRCHVTGEGLTITLIRKIARVFGQLDSATEVVIQGGDRSSGANRGSSPGPIRVRV